MGRRTGHRARTAQRFVLPPGVRLLLPRPHGLASLDEVGVDNITFETDYPHTDSTWPDTFEIATAMFAGLDDDDVRKIVRGNAIRMLHLDLAPETVLAPQLRACHGVTAPKW